MILTYVSRCIGLPCFSLAAVGWAAWARGQVLLRSGSKRQRSARQAVVDPALPIRQPTDAPMKKWLGSRILILVIGATAMFTLLILLVLAQGLIALG